MGINYTTDFAGRIAYPNDRYPKSALGGNPLPYVLGWGRVRNIAYDVAASIIADARTNPGPVVWITGNSMFPPMRAIPAAERVYQAANNEDGQLWADFTEKVSELLSEASVTLECPPDDNALYAVDLRRWQYREDAEEAEDLNDEWEQVSA